MLTKMRIIASICIALGSFAAFTAFSQESSILFATDINLNEWQAVLHAPEGRVDRQVKVVDIGNSHVAVGVLFRDPIVANDEPVTGIVHTRVSEVYYITSGSGVLVTGGTMLGRRDIPANTDIVEVLVGESFSTSVARGDGQVRLVSEGDIIVVPAGVFHGWHEVEERVEMVSIRPDPEKVLPAGYVNPYAE
jgi:mannose-6-phosphate isomerase-like protein (cupin superfamily)